MLILILFFVFIIEAADKSNLLSLPSELSIKILGIPDYISIERVINKQLGFYQESLNERFSTSRKKVDYSQTRQAFIPCFNLLLTCRHFYNNELKKELFLFYRNNRRYQKGYLFF